MDSCYGCDCIGNVIASVRSTDGERVYVRACAFACNWNSNEKRRNRTHDSWNSRPAKETKFNRSFFMRIIGFPPSSSSICFLLFLLLVCWCALIFTIYYRVTISRGATDTIAAFPAFYSLFFSRARARWVVRATANNNWYEIQRARKRRYRERVSHEIRARAWARMSKIIHP